MVDRSLHRFQNELSGVAELRRSGRIDPLNQVMHAKQ